METNALFSKKVLSGNCGLGRESLRFLGRISDSDNFCKYKRWPDLHRRRNLFPALSLVIGALNKKSQKLKQNSLDVKFHSVSSSYGEQSYPGLYFFAFSGSGQVKTG